LRRIPVLVVDFAVPIQPLGKSLHETEFLFYGDYGGLMGRYCAIGVCVVGGRVSRGVLPSSCRVLNGATIIFGFL